MHVVVIHGWQEESPELSRNLGEALGVTPYEARQRLIGGGPAVVACAGSFQQASALAGRTGGKGFQSFVLDADPFRKGTGNFPVRRFDFPGPDALRVEGPRLGGMTIPCDEVGVLVHASQITLQNEIQKTSFRKFSPGKAALTGGLMPTRKVTQKVEVATEVRDEILCVFAGKRPTVVFSKNDLLFDGLGSNLQPTRSLNFSRLVAELRRLCSGAVFDNRLLKRAGQAKLLGPTLTPENNLLLAVEILAACHRQG